MSMKPQERILLWGANIWYLGEGMLGPLFAVFTERVGGDILEISWAWATYLIVTGLLVIFVGKYIDGRFDPAKIMVAGYALNAVATFGYLLVSSPWHLFIVQAALGVANALATPTWDTLYARHGGRRHGTLIWGLAVGDASSITGIALLIGGFLVVEFSFSTLFITMGCIQTLAAIYQARILFHPST